MTGQMKTRLIVLIPVYNDIIGITERASLKQFAKVYNWKYDVRLVCPERFTDETLKQYTDILSAPENAYLQYKKYPDSYFRSAADYSRLLKTHSFWDDIKWYDYALIYQTDCWLLNAGVLDKWMDKDFDYIGAPVVTNHDAWPSAPCCGNGGLSLRKVPSFLAYTADSALTAKLDTNQTYRDYEDVFFCCGVSRYMYIDMPIWKECAEFAWDMNPDVLCDIYNLRLPEVGIHAWPKNIFFWKDKINVGDDAVAAAMEEHKQFIELYTSLM